MRRILHRLDARRGEVFCVTDTTEYITDLVDKYGNMILRIAYTYLKNRQDAEDCVQEVFLKIVEKMPSFENAEHEKSWIIRAAINICKNRLKLFWNRNVGAIDEAEKIGVFDEYDEQSGVLTAVLNLPEKYRTVIYLYYYEEYTTIEISKIVGKNESTVRSYLHRAREKLKSVLKEGYDFE